SISGNEKIMKLLDDIRNKLAILIGFASDENDAKLHSAAIPKIAIVAKPQNYVTTSGVEISTDEVDIVAKMVSMGKLHRTFAGSGLYNLAAATLLPGTIPNKVSKLTYQGKEKLIRIGHPDGIAKVRVALT